MTEIRSTIHNHCTLCDGVSTAEDMARAAYEAGFTDFGFSSHGVTPFDMWYSLKDEKGYLDAVCRIKNQYKDKMRVYCGIEQDYYAPVADPSVYDFIIGAVHYIMLDGVYYPVDASQRLMADCIDKNFSGNSTAFAAAYYAVVAENVKAYRPDVIAHFDLITKYEADYKLFDEEDGGYRKAALDALEECAAIGGVFEVNTGAMIRARKKQPYPAPFLLKRLAQLNGRVLLSADCHDKRYLTYGFNQSLALIKECGFSRITVFEKGKFIDKPLG